jgi:hypothetical protein
MKVDLTLLFSSPQSLLDRPNTTKIMLQPYKKAWRSFRTKLDILSRLG